MSIPAAQRVRFEERVEQMREFVAEHGRFPMQRERPLGDALNRWRTDATPERQAILDRELPGWRGDRGPLTRFEDRLAEAREHLERHGRLPCRSESPLGRAIAGWRHRATPDQRAEIERVLGPDWQNNSRRR